MNILHLNNQLNLACGVSNSILNLAYTTRNKYKHYILAPHGDAKEKFNKAGLYPEFILEDKITLFNSYKTIKLIADYCNKHNIDIIHSHHRTFDALSFLVNKIRKTKTVVTVHNIRYDKKMISYNSDKIIAVSDYVASHLREHYNKEETKIEIIENFINKDFITTNNYSSLLKNQLGLSETDFVMMYAGRFSEEKGADILIDAYKNVKEKHARIKLILIGDGAEKKHYTELNDKHNLGIIFLDPVENIFDYLNFADLVILPSRDEAFGNIILEAGYLGKIIIASDVGNTKSLIQNNKTGLLFQPGSSQDLSKKIQDAYNDFDNIKQLGVDLKNSLADKFDEKKFISKIENCYER
jgi:glycosyltransferase involved in cell wall biosynthesis